MPYLQGEPYLDKPPLLYWLVMTSYHIFGIHDWSARLVPALAVHACILLTYLLGRRFLGEGAAFWVRLTPESGARLHDRGQAADPGQPANFVRDPGHSLRHEAMRGERLRWGWWLLAAFACGLGVLAKGPVALLLL